MFLDRSNARRRLTRRKSIAPECGREGDPRFFFVQRAKEPRTEERRLDAIFVLLIDVHLIELFPGMKVLDMGAGAGYSTERVARAVGPNGKVYGQIPPDVRCAQGCLRGPEGDAGEEAMREPVPSFDDPVPAYVSDLDPSTFLFFYHDTTYMSVRSRRDGSQEARFVQARRRAGDRGHAAKAGADISVWKVAASHRRKLCCAARSRRPASGCDRRRFLAPSRRHQRFQHAAAALAGGRIRTKLQKP